jgi:hypothetical protein
MLAARVTTLAHEALAQLQTRAAALQTDREVALARAELLEGTLGEARAEVEGAGRHWASATGRCAPSPPQWSASSRGGRRRALKAGRSGSGERADAGVLAPIWEGRAPGF